MSNLPDRLREVADELDSLRLAEDAALMREAAEALTGPVRDGYRLEAREQVRQQRVGTSGTTVAEWPRP